MIFNRFRITNLIFLCLTLSLGQAAHAQQMDPAQMQQMIQNSGEMQKCLSRIDKSAIQALALKGEQVEAQVKALCKAGNSAQARAETMAFMREVNASSDMQAMKKCAAMNPIMMQLMPLLDEGAGKNGKDIQICDKPQSAPGAQ